jgi:A/G-specific adenine glycosylase
MPLSKKNIQTFQQKIFDWWKVNKRVLPWRHTHDQYKIMVSEVMLQQTQVQRVITKYAEFIEAYPTVKALAQAKTSDVLRIWKGMGYNRRALYLKQASEAVLRTHNGVFLATEEELLKTSDFMKKLSGNCFRKAYLPVLQVL